VPIVNALQKHLLKIVWKYLLLHSPA